MEKLIEESKTLYKKNSTHPLQVDNNDDYGYNELMMMTWNILLNEWV